MPSAKQWHQRTAAPAQLTLMSVPARRPRYPRLHRTVEPALPPLSQIAHTQTYRAVCAGEIDELGTQILRSAQAGSDSAPDAHLDLDQCSCLDVFALQERVAKLEAVQQEVISATVLCDELALLEREVSKSSIYNEGLTRERRHKYLKNALEAIARRYGLAIIPMQEQGTDKLY